MNHARHAGRRVLGVLAATLLITSCDGGGAPSPRSASEVPHAYTVRGVVLEAAPDELTIHHQAIDDYVGPDGQVIGMDPMAMRFHLAPALHGQAFHEQDVLELRFEDRPQGPGLLIVEARKLPPGTVLDFRAAHPGNKDP